MKLVLKLFYRKIYKYSIKIKESLNIVFTIICLFNEKKSRLLLQVFFLRSSIVSDKIELMMLCGVYRAIFRVLANQNRRHSRVMLELVIL